MGVLTLMRLELQNQMQNQSHYNKPWCLFNLPKHVNALLYQLVLNMSTFFLSYAEKVKVQGRWFNLKMNYRAAPPERSDVRQSAQLRLCDQPLESNTA